MRRLSVDTRRARRAPRARPASPRRRWLRRVLLRPAVLAVAGGALALALLVGGGVWLWTSGRVAAMAEALRAGAIAATADAGLVLREVYVTGRVETPREAVLAALGGGRGTPLVTIDPEAARARIEAIGWVRRASVERRFPDTVFIRLVERRPLALWQRKGRLFVIDRDGVVIEGAQPRDFAALPVIVGEDAPANAAGLIAAMATEPNLSARVRAAVRVGGRRWNLRLDNGIDVRLPEDGVAEAWRRLAEFDRRHRLLARNITAVDLRLPDRLVIVRPPGGEGKDT